MFVQEQLYALGAREQTAMWVLGKGVVSAPFRFYSGLKMLIFEDSY